MAYSESTGTGGDIQLDGFVTRHVAEFVIEDASELSALIDWLTSRQARIYHLVTTPANGAAHHVKLTVERISGTVLIGHLTDTETISGPRIEHLFVNDDTQSGTARGDALNDPAHRA